MRRQCPACPEILSRFSLKQNNFYCCREHGLLVSAPVIKGFFKDQIIAEHCLRQISEPVQNLRASQRCCPECQKNFYTFTTPTFSHVHIDICRTCRVFWFDQGEWENLKEASFHGTRSSAPSSEVKRPKLQTHKASAIEISEDVQWINFLMPLEESTRRKTTPAAVTYTICFMAFLATAMAMRQTRLFEQWAFLPQDFFARYGLTHVTSLFVHGSLLHFLSNAVFLLITGDDAEDEMGHWEFLQLFFLSGVFGHLVYALSGGVLPSVGMSGAVAGVMSYYAIRFPNHRISIARMFSWGLQFKLYKISFSARAFVGLYIVTNLAGFFFQVKSGGGGETNYAAHVGGFVFGGLWALHRRQ